MGLKTKSSRKIETTFRETPSLFINPMSLDTITPVKRKHDLILSLYANERLIAGLGNMCERSDYTLYRQNSVDVRQQCHTYRGWRSIPLIKSDDFCGIVVEIIGIYHYRGNLKRASPGNGNYKFRGRSVAQVSKKAPPSYNNTYQLRKR